jgi:hypothetical protein
MLRSMNRDGRDKPGHDDGKGRPIPHRLPINACTRPMVRATITS